MKATADTNANVAEAKRRLRGVIGTLRKARRDMLSIARFLHDDPLCKATERRDRAGEEWAHSVPYSIEGACISIAKDYLTKDAIVPLEKELTMTPWESARIEENTRRMMQAVERRIKAERAAEARKALRRAA